MEFKVHQLPTIVYLLSSLAILGNEYVFRESLADVEHVVALGVRQAVENDLPTSSDFSVPIIEVGVSPCDKPLLLEIFQNVQLFEKLQGTRI